MGVLEEALAREAAMPLYLRERLAGALVVVRVGDMREGSGGTGRMCMAVDRTSSMAHAICG